MIDNSRAKNHIDSTINTLNDLTQYRRINELTSKMSLDLINNLSGGNNLFLDDEVISGITSLYHRLAGGGGIEQLSRDITNEITELRDQETRLIGGTPVGGTPAGGATPASPFEHRIGEIQRQINDLNNITRNTTARTTEYQTLLTEAQRFNLTSNLTTPPDINIARVPIAGPTIALDPFRNVATGVPAHPNYTLCDDLGSNIPHTGNDYKIQIGGIEYTFGNIQFRGNSLDLSAMTITPRLTKLPQKLNLSITALNPVRIGTRTINIAYNKKIQINLTDGSVPLDAVGRRNAYDNLRPPMNERIQAEYSNKYREDIENEQLWRILREGRNDTEIDEIYNNQNRKKALQDRMRRLLNTFFPLGVITLTDLQTGFRTDMTRIDRDVPAEYLVNERTFTDYIRHNIPESLKNYASSRIYNQLSTTPGIRTEIIRELLTFQSDVANNPVDNYDNLRAMAMIPNDNQGPQGHPNNFWQRIRGRRSRKNNYTKFFQGREASLDNQTLETEEGTIKYGVHVEVQSTNKITATINIDGKNEPEIIDAANHDRLIRGILNRANTKDGEPLNRKLRCNIALSVLKAMVMMSPQTLSREIPPMDFRDNEGNTIHCDRIEAYIEGGNLRLRGGIVNNAGPTRRTRRNADIFDESSFKSLHDVNMLENGVRQLSTQVNSIMNATANEYNEATNTILRNKSLRTYDTAQFLRFGPAKRLRGRMVYGKTNNDFNFETSVNDAGKSVNIMFNKGLFTVSGQFDGQEYQYQGKDLGLILRKKINRKRVFDGIELSMVSAINEEFIQRLRTNHFIQTENFAVLDTNANKTGRIYIFDEGGDLSYLDIEDRGLNPIGGRNAGRIDPDAIPAERIRCNAKERKEFFQNPFLSGRLIRTMRRRLALY